MTASKRGTKKSSEHHARRCEFVARAEVWPYVERCEATASHTVQFVDGDHAQRMDLCKAHHDDLMVDSTVTIRSDKRINYR